MPPRRNVRKKATPQKQVKQLCDSEMKEDVDSAETSEVADNGNSVTDENTESNDLNVTQTECAAEGDDTLTQGTESNDKEVKMEGNDASGNNQDDEYTNLPYRVRVSNLPASYVLNEFQKHIRHTFNIAADNIITPEDESTWLIIPFATENEQEYVVKLLNNHVWKKKALRAIAFHASESLKHKLENNGDEDNDESDPKKAKLEENVLSLEEEILSESLPLYNVPYEEQNKLSIQDVQLLSNKLHAFMCVRNPALAGWAEAMCDKNQGFIYKIEPLKPSPILKGYRNKCKFRIGKNADGEFTVGFCLNDNEKKILGVQPGDRLIHLPDSMKYAAKMFEKFIQKSGKEPYDKKKKSGFWDHVIIRMAPGGELMLVVVMYHNHLSDENIASIKNDVKEFFTNEEGKDCNLYSLYFQVMNDKTPILPPDKLELLSGEPALIEKICGLKFHVGPYSILNVNSPSAENIYKSIVELAEPTKESMIIDICSGTGGIAFTLADKCKQVIAIETQEDNINDALKTKELNGITNVEFIKGKAEDELSGVFEKIGNSQIIPIIDPPRQGLVQKAVSLLRSNNDINKLVYVCSNSKMGVKNFLDLCSSSEKKEGTFGNPLNVEFAGLPFLPVKAIPVDVSPYTVNNTIIILFERIDPSTFPPAKNPPPVPMKKPQQPKEEKKKQKKGHGNRRGGKNFNRFNGRGRNKKFTSQRGRGGGGGGGGSGSGSGGPRFIRNPRRGGNNPSGMGFNNQNRPNRFPPPLMRPLDPALTLVAKYERRIAELEQQDRAFKAGLTMGLQALGSRTGTGPMGTGDFGNYSNSNNSTFRNLGEFTSNDNFGGFNRGFKDNLNQFDRDRNAWQRNSSGRNNFGNTSNLGNGFGGIVGGNNFGGNFGGGAFNNFGGGPGFGNFGLGSGFNNSFGNIGGSGVGSGGNFRNAKGNNNNKSRWSC